MHAEGEWVDRLCTPSRRTAGTFADLGKIVALAAVYFVTGKLGLKAAFLHESASAIWPPTGIALATLLLAGNRLWPGVWLGAFLVNITTGGSVLTTVGIATGNTIEAVLGTWLVGHMANGLRAFDRARDILRFTLLAVIPSAAISATFGVTSLALGGFAAWGSYGPIWETWWFGDVISALVITPLAVIWSRAPSPRWSRREALEFMAILAVVAAVAVAGFSVPYAAPDSRYPRFLLYPAVLWAAYRFCHRGAISAVFIVSAISIWGTVRGLGPFASSTPNESLVLLQAFLAALAITNLVLGALVSERRQVEQSLRESQVKLRGQYAEIEERIRERTAELARVNARFQAMYDQGLFAGLLTVDGTLIDVNRSCLETSGFTRSEVLGKPFWETGWWNRSPNVQAWLKAGFAEAVDGRPFHGVSTYFVADGSERIIDFAFMPIKDEAGTVVHVVPTGLDITDRARAEEERRTAQVLRDSEVRFRNMADNAPVLIWESDTTKLCTWFNKGWLDFVGRALEQEVGDGWAENVHRDDLDRCLQTYVKSFDARRPFEMEYRLRRHDGEHRWILDRGTPIYDASGNFTGYIGSCIDITERKRAEQELRASQAQLAGLIKSAMDAIIAVDAAQRVVLFNPAAERMFGRAADEVLGRPIDQFIPARFHETHRKHIERFGARGTTNRRMGVLGALSGLRANGDEFPIEASISHMEVEDQKLFTVILRDITERKIVEAELKAWQHELESRVEQRTVELVVAHRQLQTQIEERKRLELEIAHAVEHEQQRLGQELHDSLGQQLAGIGYMMTALAAKLKDTSPTRAREAKKLERLIVQSVGQVRNLAMSFYPVELERHGLVSALEEVAHRTERSYGVRCDLQANGGFDPENTGLPPIQLFRIAQEAVHNAVKHAGAKRIVIHLDSVDDNITLTIKDDGAGLPPDFDKKAGMGLHIMRYRAHMIGGTLDVRNAPEGGAVVACYVSGNSVAPRQPTFSPDASRVSAA